MIVLAHRRGSLLDSGDTEINETYWPSTRGPRHGSSCIFDLQNTSSATDRLNLVKNFEVSQFLPCRLTPVPSAVSSAPCPTALFWGTGSNSSRVFCSCLPSLQIGSPQRPPVLAVGGCWRCPPHRAAQRDARSVFTRSLCCWRIVTLPGKNPVSLRVRRLAGITLVFMGGPGAGVQLYLVSFKHPGDFPLL